MSSDFFNDRDNSVFQTVNLIVQIFSNLNYKHKKILIFLLIYTLITASLEIISLGIVVPFLGLLLNESYINQIPYLDIFFKYMQTYFGMKPPLIISIIFVTMAVIVTFARIYLLKFNALFVVLVGSDLSIKVFNNNLMQPYWYHVNKNSSDILTNIKERVDITVFAVLLPALNLMTNLIIVSFIITFLFFINYKVASSICLIFLPIYIFVVTISKKKLHKNSFQIHENQPKTIKIIQEALGSIRDIIMSQNQSIYLEKYKLPDYSLRYAQSNNILIASIPRFILECVGIILIASVAIFVIITDQSLVEIIPILGALALGAQRILPLLQQAYAAWASIVGYGTSALPIIKNLKDERAKPKNKILKEYKFKDSIEFKNVSFSYNSEKIKTIKNLNFIIKKGDRVAIIGKTGSGKSTIIDLIVGLLKPTGGKIYIDGQELEKKNVKNWQISVSLVPQYIFLSDESILENICIGLTKEKFDIKNAEESIIQAELKAFVDTLPNGYNTQIGERGVRLSGGQRQRIGLARAFYKKKKIIILDEATNALDEKTENIILNNLKKLSKDITLIIISHRPKTVAFCNKIIRV